MLSSHLLKFMMYLKSETIATCMSELVRYNLEKFPVATLQEELQQVQLLYDYPEHTLSRKILL